MKLKQLKGKQNSKMSQIGDKKTKKYTTKLSDDNFCDSTVWRPKNVSPCIDLVLLSLHFLVLWDCRIHNLSKSRVALSPGLGCSVRDVASSIIFHKGEVGAILLILFSVFACFGCQFWF